MQEATITPVPEFTFVLHGANGDLAKRKIIPALAHLAHSGYFPPQAAIVLAMREPISPSEFVQQVSAFLMREGNVEAAMALPALLPMLQTMVLNLGEANAQAALAQQLQHAPKPIVHYAALPSAQFLPLIHILPNQTCAQDLRLVLEKPMGQDGHTCSQIESAIAAKFDESQIYRIDHYLGKQAVQNLLALRLGNLIFEPLLNRNHVAYVELSVLEDLGIEGRAGFYEQTGALRDMVQSHLLQLLAIVAMEPPISLDADHLRDEKLKVLRALKIPTLAPCPNLILGQYGSGFHQGQVVPGYCAEVGVNPQSKTETFVALQSEVQTWRWAGVPFLLRTGKRMHTRRSEIVIQFRDVPKPLFEPVLDDNTQLWQGSRLIIQLQPQDKLELQLLAKMPGERERLKPVSLDLDFFEAWRIPVRDAYERLLTDILRGRLGLFLRNDEVAAQWSFVDALHKQFFSQHDCIQNPEVNSHTPYAYAAGSAGPKAAATMAARYGAFWNCSDTQEI